MVGPPFRRLDPTTRSALQTATMTSKTIKAASVRRVRKMIRRAFTDSVRA
jgi:hypothetical protein